MPPGGWVGKTKHKPRRTEDARAGAQGHPQKQGKPTDETPAQISTQSPEKLNRLFIAMQAFTPVRATMKSLSQQFGNKHA